MSPGETAREKTLSLLADPVTGINRAFAASCHARGIPVPLPGDGDITSESFDFSDNSNTVLRMQDNIDWISRNSNQQYPCIVAWSNTARQDKGRRPLGSKFAGDVMVMLEIYVGWLAQEPPANDDFERTIDALEEAILNVLNANVYAWHPVIYNNLLDTTRMPMELTNENQVIRRCLRVEITTTVIFTS